jgi:hypothetical protein
VSLGTISTEVPSSALRSNNVKSWIFPRASEEFKILVGGRPPPLGRVHWRAQSAGSPQPLRSSKHALEGQDFKLCSQDTKKEPSRRRVDLGRNATADCGR